MKTFDNIFHTLITLLKVKHTDSFTNKLYEEHPHKNDLYGLSVMLKEYNIDNIGLNITDKKDKLNLLETPFVAYCGNDFVIVTNTTANIVEYLWRGKNISLETNKFIELWNGIVLLIETNKNSIEPGYNKNIVGELFKKTRIILFLLFILSVVINRMIDIEIFDSIGILLLLFANFIGTYICFLLVKKQSNIKSKLSDKICSVFLKSDCNNVLESDASKILGIISLSEVGLSYFISNILIILFFRQLLSFLTVINIFSLFFIFWSIWYQKVKIEQWCALCLIVQLLLLCNFVINYSFNFINIPALTFHNLFYFCLIYLSPFLIVSWLIQVFNRSRTISNIKYELNSLKSDEDVFKTILLKNNYYDVSVSDSKILFGNPDSSVLITVITNPHCNPCARMHPRIIEFINKSKDKYCIQYFFSSFNDNLDSSNKFLIAVYLNNDLSKRENIISEWYNKGKDGKNNMFNLFNYNLDDNDVIQEFKTQKSWLQKSKIKSTPTILINGFELPKKYNIEDLIGMELDIDIN